MVNWDRDQKGETKKKKSHFKDQDPKLLSYQ